MDIERSNENERDIEREKIIHEQKLSFIVDQTKKVMKSEQRKGLLKYEVIKSLFNVDDEKFSFALLSTIKNLKNISTEVKRIVVRNPNIYIECSMDPMVF